MFSIPAVQTKVAQNLTEYLNKELDTDIQIKKFKITYDAKVNLQDVFLGDHHGDTLIAAEHIKTSLINIPGIIAGKNIDFGNVTATHLTFRLRRYEGDEKDSFGIFLDKVGKKEPREDGIIVNFTHLNIVDSKFSFYDEQGRYPDIISLTKLNIDASDFIIHGGDINLKINSLNGIDRRGVVVKDLSTDFMLDESHMNFDNFSLQTKYSNVEANVYFTYDDTMTDFEDRVQVNADFKKASVSTTDLRNFYSEFGNGHDLTFRGKMKGVLNDFELHDFFLTGINRTTVDGNIAIKNMLEESGFEISGMFNRLETDYYDLINFLPGVLQTPLPKSLTQFGTTSLRGYLSANASEIHTNSTINSKLGEAKLNAVLSNLDQLGNQTYSGNIDFDDFDLGDVLNNPNFGKASFSMDLKGKGLTKKDLNSELKGTFSKLEFKGYVYQDIDVNGIFKSPIFMGEVISRDPNLKMKFDGLADISTVDYTNYDFKAEVEYADLYAMNIKRNDSIARFKGDVNISMVGTSIDDIVGNIDVENASFENRKGKYEFGKLNLNSSFEDGVRKITVNSPDVVKGEVNGRFTMSELGPLFKNAIGNLYSNYKEEPIQEHQFMDFDVTIHSKIVEALYPDISLAPGTRIKGEVKSDNSKVRLDIKSSEIVAYKNKFENINLQIDNTNQLFGTYFEIDSLSTPYYNFSRMNWTTNRRNDTLYIRSDFRGGNQNKDNYDLNFYYTIDKKSRSIVGLRPSELTFRETTWQLNPNAENQRMRFDNDFINLDTDTLMMEYENQKIAFNGFKRGDDEMELNLDFLDVDLAKITPSLEDFDFAGVLNGRLEVDRHKGVFYPISNLNIDDFKVNDIDYGDLTMNIEGNESLTSYTVHTEMTGDKYDFMKADGEINVDGDDPKIDIDFALDNFKIDVLNAFGKEVIADVRGLASGRAKLTGSYKKPLLEGKLNLKKGGIKFPYLNVDIALEDNATVDLNENGFYFDHIAIEDTKYHTKGEVNGTIEHSYFKDWGLDMRLKAPDRLLVLDTDYTEDALYYGQAFIDGNARIDGPFDELVIDVNATSQKGTVFKIPLSDAESLADNQFIYFLTSSDKEARKKGEEIVIQKLKGLELNFDLNVTDDAAIEIVIDQQSGSTLKGKGAGTLLLEINTNGKFNMWGDFVVYQGVYDFKYGGLIEKEFEVVPGGSMTWDGNPLQANLNVRALYQTEANPASILENPTINRPIPINVYVDLSGLLTNVDISFDLEYPNLSSVVKSELEYRISDRESTEIQAMSLIAQRSFYSDMGTGRNTHPENLLYERAAGLFNDIFSGEEDIFKVGLNYTKGNRTPDQDYSDRVGVTLSTNVSDRVLINGRVGVPVGGLTRSVVVGNVEMEILLNEEGTLRAKMFNRESDIQYIGEELGYTQGIGLSYSVDFDTFKELIQKILNKKIEVSEIRREVEKDEKESLMPEYIYFPGT